MTANARPSELSSEGRAVSCAPATRFKSNDRLREAFLQARRLKGDNGPTLYSLASSYLHLDRPDEALPVLHECLKLNFERPDTLSLLGRAHLQLGDREQAIECWQAALQADPSHGPARWHLYEVGAGPEPAALPLTTKQRKLKRLAPVIKARMKHPLVRRCGEIVLTLDPEVGFVLEDGENPGNATIHAGGPFRVYDRVPRADLLDLIGMLKMLLVLVNNENTRDVAVLAYYAAHPSFNYQVRFQRGKVIDTHHDGRFIVDEAPRFFKIRIDSDLATPYGEPMQGKLIYLSQPKGPGFMVSTLGKVNPPFALWRFSDYNPFACGEASSAWPGVPAVAITGGARGPSSGAIA